MSMPLPEVDAVFEAVFEAKKYLLAAVTQRDARIKELENIIRALGASVPVETISKLLEADGESKALNDYLNAIVDLCTTYKSAYESRAVESLKVEQFKK